MVKTISREELKEKLDRGEDLVLIDKLAAMGYGNVRDYVGGKKDWIDAGLPAEGRYYERRRNR